MATPLRIVRVKLKYKLGKMWILISSLIDTSFLLTHVENYHYWVLLTLSRDHYFRYRECTGGRRSLEAAF